jgi:hypothetical protein
MHGHFIAALLASASILAAPELARAQAQQAADIKIDSKDIAGVVASAHGPEVGVWVIAETQDLPTKFSRIVVTDDLGRYLIPDLPKAHYDVWVRGYGLVDSPKVKSDTGKILNLTAVVAPSPAAAAQYYPGNYWYSLLKIPDQSEFPGTGPTGNGISPAMKSQAQWVAMVLTTGCQPCHQLGDKATRELPESLGKFPNAEAAWSRRVESGQAGASMVNILVGMGKARAIKEFASWTDRIATGELPFAVPPRPQGLERNVVVTNWDFGDSAGYLHDAASTDKRHPTVNANGPIFAAPELSSDKIAVLDPVANRAYDITVPLADQSTNYAAPQQNLAPSPYFGDGILWKSRANPHSVMMDSHARVWVTAVGRPPENPAFCKEESDNPSAKLYPLERSSRQVSFYDQKTKEWQVVNLCFSTLHLQFADDANDTLWSSSPGGQDAVGWLNTKLFDQTHDPDKSQGWTATVLDTNGNGKRDAYVEPDQPPDPAKDKRIHGGMYSVMENPVDHSIWGTALAFPGGLVRLELGNNPPATTTTEYFESPWDDPNPVVRGSVPRALDIDRSGVVWANLTGNSRLASFDRRKCKAPLNGPNATGRQCPEGWTSYTLPGPQFRGLTEPGSATATYLLFVDQFNTFGLGENVPIAIGNGADALFALPPGSDKFVTLRVPYPMSFFAKGLDGRIDDPNGGWKGRGLWVSSGTRAPWHVEGGLGEKPKLTKFQLRPDPLAD